LNGFEVEFSFEFGELFIVVFEDDEFGGASDAIFFSQSLFVSMGEEGFVNDFGDSIISLECLVGLGEISNIQGNEGLSFSVVFQLGRVIYLVTPD